MILFLCVLTAAANLCFGEIWTSPSKLDSAEIEEVLKVHNDFRTSIGASNMLKLRWDPDLADLAQGHADHCADYHTNMKLLDGRIVGQNLAMSTSSAFPLSRGINNWISEKEFYDFKTIECQGGWKPCGHLTQVITARTQWIGCAIKRDCEGKWKTQMICNYYPGNNIRTTFAHGVACSACPGGTCENGLCACKNPHCVHGRLDLQTCVCKCGKLYGGPACDVTKCPTQDQSYCGSGFTKSDCEEYDNVKEECPYMCGLC